MSVVIAAAVGRQMQMISTNVLIVVVLYYIHDKSMHEMDFFTDCAPIVLLLLLLLFYFIY
jgi:hypothetical protein